MTADRIPSLNWLRVFEAAARCESFARAADHLNMTPAAVSQQIRALEQHLGQPLFERGPQHVRLSEAGAAFLPAVRESLGAVETTAAALFGSRTKEHLSVQASQMFACGWLAPRLAGFHATHPDVALQLTTGNLPEDFLRSSADVQIMFGGDADFPESAERLMAETLVPVARPDIAARITSADDLTSQPLIEVSTHRTGWLQVLRQRADTSRPPDLRFVDTTSVALALAAGGAGIALARAPASDGLVAAYGLDPCGGVAPIAGDQSYFLVFPASVARKPSIAAFRDWIVGEAVR